METMKSETDDVDYSKIPPPVYPVTVKPTLIERAVLKMVQGVRQVCGAPGRLRDALNRLSKGEAIAVVVASWVAAFFFIWAIFMLK